MSTILLIDDDADVRATVRMMLESGGCRVVEAKNGREAIGNLRDRQIDLVITDILMPDSDSLETIRELVRAGNRIPIIAMSGGGAMDSLSVLDIARKFGARSVLTKPFRSRELLAAVKAALNDEAVIEPVA